MVDTRDHLDTSEHGRREPCIGSILKQASPSYRAV